MNNWNFVLLMLKVQIEENILETIVLEVFGVTQRQFWIGRKVEKYILFFPKDIKIIKHVS